MSSFVTHSDYSYKKRILTHRRSVQISKKSAEMAGDAVHYNSLSNDSDTSEFSSASTSSSNSALEASRGFMDLRFNNEDFESEFRRLALINHYDDESDSSEYSSNTASYDYELATRSEPCIQMMDIVASPPRRAKSTGALSPKRRHVYMEEESTSDDSASSMPPDEELDNFLSPSASVNDLGQQGSSMRRRALAPAEVKARAASLMFSSLSIRKRYLKRKKRMVDYGRTRSDTDVQDDDTNTNLGLRLVKSDSDKK